ncbi:MAG: sensor histidine kinase [Treponema sp.]|nr:sensor histidine kinase [Treponema sp.]
MSSIVPLFLLSFVFMEISQWMLQRNSARQANDVINSVAKTASETVGGAFSLAEELASSPFVIDWCAGLHSEGEKGFLENNVLISNLFQDIAQRNKDNFYQVYIVSYETERTISREIVPAEYNLSAYSDWGVFHRIKEKGSGTLFVQPHHLIGKCIAAVCVPVVNVDGINTGCIIVDILRSGFASKLSKLTGINIFSQFYMFDSSGCIAYSGYSAEAEGSFIQDVQRPLNKSKLQPVCQTVSFSFLDSSLCVCGLLPADENLWFVQGLRHLTLKTALLTALFAVLISAVISRSVAQPVKTLASAMQRAEAGELDVQCPEPDQPFADRDMTFLIKRFNKMVKRISQLTDDRVEQQRLLRVSEVKSLQAQISPHFLYNTLNSIKSMAKFAGASKIAKMVTNLGKLLRDSFASEGDFCSIEHSLEIVRNYFDIESMRWENKFLFVEEIDQELLPYPIPRLIIQPVVENALVHGLEEKNEGGTLFVRGFFKKREDGNRDIIIEVQDDGIGMDEKTLLEIKENLRTITRSKRLGSNGIALVNTHSRLRLLYGEPYGLSISSKEGEGTTVIICIPEDLRHDASSGY